MWTRECFYVVVYCVVDGFVTFAPFHANIVSLYSLKTAAGDLAKFDQLVNEVRSMPNDQLRTVARSFAHFLALSNSVCVMEFLYSTCCTVVAIFVVASISFVSF